MGKVDKLFENSPASESVAGMKRIQTKSLYTVAGNEIFPSGTPPTTIEKLEAGVYKACTNMAGQAFFSIHEAKTDELLRFEDPRHELVIGEIKKFWERKESFKEMGFTHKRGMLLTGDPGTGKSCILKLVMEDVVAEGDLVFIVREPYSLIKCLESLREIEPDRNVLAVMEDADEMCRYSEHAMLELFDGDNQFDNLLILGTTNYPDRFAPRMMRPGRFDRKLQISVLPEAGRKAYFQKKLGANEKTAVHVDKYVNLTKGFSFAQMREFLVATHCLGHTPMEAAKRVRSGKIEEGVSEVTESDLDSKLTGKDFSSKLLESMIKRTSEG